MKLSECDIGKIVQFEDESDEIITCHIVGLSQTCFGELMIVVKLPDDLGTRALWSKCLELIED